MEMRIAGESVINACYHIDITAWSCLVFAGSVAKETIRVFAKRP